MLFSYQWKFNEQHGFLQISIERNAHFLSFGFWSQSTPVWNEQANKDAPLFYRSRSSNLSAFDPGV
jgi:hypothetical protein